MMISELLTALPVVSLRTSLLTGLHLSTSSTPMELLTLLSRLVVCLRKLLHLLYLSAIFTWKRESLDIGIRQLQSIMQDQLVRRGLHVYKISSKNETVFVNMQ